MNLKKLKKILKKGIKGSMKKQLKLFTKNKKTSYMFYKILNSFGVK